MNSFIGRIPICATGTDRNPADQGIHCKIIGDRPEPPPQQGLVDLDEGPGIDGPEQELKPWLSIFEYLCDLQGVFFDWSPEKF